MRPFVSRSVLAVVCACAALAYAGCASDGASRRERAEQREEAATAIPEMEAAAAFFGGQVQVSVLLNRGGFHAPASGGETRVGEGGSSGRGRGGFRGGFGGMGGRGGGRGRGGEGAGGRGEGGEGGEAPAPHIIPASQPPVALHLRLKNHTGVPLVVEVPDFESDLGNFVVQPDKITVPANGSADAYPMTSRLGVTQATIPLTVALRLNGQTETQTLSLHIKAPPAPGNAATPESPAAPPPPAPSPAS